MGDDHPRRELTRLIPRVGDVDLQGTALRGRGVVPAVSLGTVQTTASTEAAQPRGLATRGTILNRLANPEVAADRVVEHPVGQLNSLSTTPKIAAVAVAPVAVQQPSGTITGLLSAVGLGTTLIPNAPAAPADTPAIWAVLGWVRRQFAYTFDNQRPAQSVQQQTVSLVNGTGTAEFGLTGASDPDPEDVPAYQPGSYVGTGGGTLVVADDGTAVYMPKTGWTGSAYTDTFSVITTDEGGSWHVHGISGLLNTVTFGLLGESGHTATHTVSVAVALSNPAPVIDEDAPYTLSPQGPDPETGAISGKVNVTDDDTLTYYVVTGPDPALGTLVLNEQTGEWTFTPNPRTRVLAGIPMMTQRALTESATTQAEEGLTVSFAIAATDGTTATAPIVVTEKIAGVETAAVPLPAGTLPVLAYVDPDTGDGYVFSYDQEHDRTQLAAVIHSDGSYSFPTGSTATGAAAEAFRVGDTTYVVTLDYDESANDFHTYISELGPAGLTAISGPIPGRLLDVKDVNSVIRVGDTIYLVTRSENPDAVHQTYLTAVGPNGVLHTTSAPGIATYSLVAGDTTYLISITIDETSGEQIHVTGVGPNGVTPTTSVSGWYNGNPVTVGDTAYLTTQTGDVQSGFETHLIGLAPGGVISTAEPMPGYRLGDPITVGDTTYVLTTTDSRFMTHVMALTPDGATPAGSIPGYVVGDPFVIDGTTYLVSGSGEGDPATWTTYLTALDPDTTPMVTVTDYVYGYAPAPGAIVVDDETYLVTFTYDANAGYQVQLMGVDSGALAPVGDPVQSYRAYDPVEVDGTTYLVTTQYNSTGSYTHLWEVGSDGLTRVGDPVRHEVDQLAYADAVVVGDTTYLLVQTKDSTFGYRTSLMSIGPDGLTPVTGPAPGRYVDVALVVGDTTYLVTETGDDLSNYQTYVTAVAPEGGSTTSVAIPGSLDRYVGRENIVVVGGTTYLITQVGLLDTAQTYFTAVDSGGAVTINDPISAEILDDPIVSGDTTYVLVAEYSQIGEYEYRVDHYRVVALTDGATTGLPSYEIPGTLLPGESSSANPIVAGDTTYLVSFTGDFSAGLESYRTYVTALTPDGVRPVADPFVGFPAAADSAGPGIFVLGDTTYMMTSGGLWAIAVDDGFDARDL